MVFLPSLLTALLAAKPILAWGGLGHRTVAYLGQMYFSAEGAAFVDDVLDDPHWYDISDAAVWPDGSVRWRRPYTKQWHYIDAQDDPPSSCGVTYNRDCNQHGTPGCVVSAIANMTALVNDPAADAQSQKEALMFIIHFIGDVHQPLHTENASRGGNDISVCFDDACHKTNLHSVWDTQIPLKSRGLEGVHENHTAEKAEAKKWAAFLFEAAQDAPVTAEGECTDVEDAQGCALEWAKESNRWVCDYVMAEGVEWLETHNLGGDYYKGAAAVVDSMVSKAGLRLGAWINALAKARAAAAALSSSPSSSEGRLVQQDQASQRPLGRPS